jgi:pyrophosphatase PpaX
MTRRRAVLLDWDGTLVDSREALLRSYHEVTSAVLGAPFPVTAQDRARILPLRGTESFQLLSDDPKVVQALADGFHAAYLRIAAQVVRPYPGARELLIDLRAAGVSTAVVTSKTGARLKRDVQLCDLEGAVDVVVNGDDVVCAKPDPEAVLLALSRLDAAPADAVMIGDSPADVVAGRSAGTATIGLTHGLHTKEELEHAGPDQIVDDLHQTRAALVRFWGGTLNH